jgi:hypothetical protein
MLLICCFLHGEDPNEDMFSREGHLARALPSDTIVVTSECPQTRELNMRPTLLLIFGNNSASRASKYLSLSMGKNEESHLKSVVVVHFFVFATDSSPLSRRKQ